MTTLPVALVLAAGALGSLSLAAAGPAAADVVEPFGKRYDASLYGDFTTVGNTVMGCPTAPADPAARCAAAATGRSGDDNNAFVMQRVNTASMAAGFGSSTGRVEVPAGAQIAYARLFWGGNDGTYKGPDGTRLGRCDASGADAAPSPGDPATTAPRIRVGSGAATEVSIDSMVTDPEEITGPHYYTGESDVTAAFADVRGGTQVAVGNVWAPNGKGCVAGWSLTVVYSYPGADPTHAPDRRHVYVYGGHVLQRPTSPATTVTVDGFHRTAGRARASVTAYEGDWNTPGDMFLVNGENVTEPRTGNINNFFVGGDTGAVSPDAADNLSIDVKSFDVPDGAIPQGARSADLTFRTAGDAYVPSALVFSVPVRDPESTRPTPAATPTPAGTQARTAAAAGAPAAPSAPSWSPSPSPTPPSDSPTPVPDPATHRARPAAHGPGGSMAETGGNGERLWLLGGLALALAATGAVAKAAMHSRRQP